MRFLLIPVLLAACADPNPETDADLAPLPDDRQVESTMELTPATPGDEAYLVLTAGTTDQTSLIELVLTIEGATDEPLALVTGFDEIRVEDTGSIEHTTQVDLSGCDDVFSQELVDGGCQASTIGAITSEGPVQITVVASGAAGVEVWTELVDPDDE
jgi:hypothetical protein